MPQGDGRVACDIENAIKVCGLDRVVGACRPRAGCACAGLVSASTASTPSTQRAPDVANSDEARAAPAVVWRRRPMTWCESAPLDGSSPQSAIRRSMRWIASRAGVAHLAPGALDAASSALCAFLSTVVAKARGVEHPLLREAAESDSRVDRLVALVHTSCAAPLSSDDESESDCDEAESEADSDRTDIRYAWEHTLRTRWTEAPGHDGLTEHVILRALEALDYKVYGGNPTLSEMARAYHERFGRDVLGLLRDGILNVERFLSELDDELKDVVDDRVFGLRLTKSTEGRGRTRLEPCCGAVGCLCPCCGRECLLWRRHQVPGRADLRDLSGARGRHGGGPRGTGARRGTLDGLRLFRPRSARRSAEALDRASGAPAAPAPGDGRRGARGAGP